MYRRLLSKLGLMNKPSQELKAIKLNLLIEVDEVFNKLYDEGSKITSTPDTKGDFNFSKRWMRFYNLLEFYKYVINLDGYVVECGCWLGLSSYILNKYNQDNTLVYKGENYLIIDSFEGLSAPTDEDLKGDYIPEKGTFSSNINLVKNALSEFPNIQYFKGWIPSVLEQIPQYSYKFVHIDLDLYEPIKTSIEYFYPKLIKGGVILFDDYGSNLWPGAKKAIDDFCLINEIKLLRLSTGQSVIFKD